MPQSSRRDDMALTDLACRTAKPKDRAYKLYDGQGLYLEVSPKGGRYWRMKYQLHQKEKRLSFGIYPQVSLLEARQKREAAIELVRQLIDPAITKKEEKRLAAIKAAQTFELVALEWHEHYKNDKWSEGHASDILYRLKKDVFSQIGNYPIDKLTAPILFNCIKKIEDRGAKDMARRALQYCGQILRYAVVTGRAERDFTSDMKGVLKKRTQGHFASIKVEELPTLVKKLNHNEARLFRQTVLAIRLMLLTFVRTKELLEAKWSEFDFEKNEWHIPAERMKMRRPHLVPLSRQAIAILKELEELNGKREFVFPSIPRPRQHMSNGTILMALDRMGYRGKMTGHGFRALAMGTIKEKLRYRHEVIDRQLAHVPANKVDKAYDRAEFLQERKKMMQRWADYIDSLV